MALAKAKYEKWLTSEGLTLLEGWARDGLTDEQIASNMGVADGTLYRWLQTHREICEALKKGKEVADYEVESALFKRANGYDYYEETEELIADKGQRKRHDEAQELTEEDWRFAKNYFGGACAYCGRVRELTKDHLDPLANGGKLNRPNVVPACRQCNSSKKDNQWLAWFGKQKFYSPDRAKKITEYTDMMLLLPEADKPRLVVTKRVKKHVPADTTAQIFWLKNRRPDKWRDRREVQNELSGGLMVKNPYAGLSTEELRKLAGDDDG